MPSDSEHSDETNKDVTPHSLEQVIGSGGRNAVVIDDLEYLRDPDKALAAMRSGTTVIVEPTNGGARMVLFGQLLSDLPA